MYEVPINPHYTPTPFLQISCSWSRALPLLPPAAWHKDKLTARPLKGFSESGQNKLGFYKTRLNILLLLCHSSDKLCDFMAMTFSFSQLYNFSLLQIEIECSDSVSPIRVVAGSSSSFCFVVVDTLQSQYENCLVVGRYPKN